jgi:hypothetical protein
MTGIVAARAGFAGVIALPGQEGLIVVLPRSWSAHFSQDLPNAAVQRAGLGCLVLFEGEPQEVSAAVCDRIRNVELPADEEGRPVLRIVNSRENSVRVASSPFRESSAAPGASPIDAIGLLLGVAARRRESVAFSTESMAQVGLDSLVGSKSRTPSLLILTHLMFVEALRAELERFRRRYIDVEQHLSVIRGRLTPQGLVAAGLPFPAAMECATDDFDVSHPAVRALAAALDAVAAGEGLKAWKSAARNSSMRFARNLRLRMREIPSLPRPAALRQLQTQHGPHAFASPFLGLLATAILNRRPTAHGSVSDPSQCMMFGMDLHRVWEQCIREAVAPGGTLPEPWIACGKSMRLDASSKDRRHILDAKYKFRPAGETPSTADQYQMLAYSISEPRCERVSLVYPTDAAGAGNIETWRRRVPNHDCELRAVTARFPSVPDLRSPRAWSTYLTDLGAQLA